jgi:hypothetical protein
MTKLEQYFEKVGKKIIFAQNARVRKNRMLMKELQGFEDVSRPLDLFAIDDVPRHFFERLTE